MQRIIDHKIYSNKKESEADRVKDIVTERKAKPVIYRSTIIKGEKKKKHD